MAKNPDHDREESPADRPSRGRTRVGSERWTGSVEPKRGGGTRS